MSQDRFMHACRGQGMVGMKSRHTSGKLSSQLWIVLMCGAFLSLALSIAVNRAMGKDSQEGLIMRIIVQTVFLSMWAWYTFDVCRTRLPRHVHLQSRSGSTERSLWRALRLLQIEAGRVRGPPRRQAFWAAKIVCWHLSLRSPRLAGKCMRSFAH